MSALGINTCKKGGKQDWTEGEVGLLSSHNAIANSERNSEKRLIPVLQGKANSDSTLELFLLTCIYVIINGEINVAS